MRGMSLVWVALTACGSEAVDTEEPEPLTCETIADTGFCWNIGASEAYECIPEADSVGVFDEARTTCTLGSGIEVVFDEPVPVDPFDDAADGYRWTFSILDASGECARFVDRDGAYTLTSSAGVVRGEVYGLFGLEVTCPDESTFAASSVFDLFSCEEGSPPGYSYTGNISWQLLGGGDGRSLFTCE
jgi:hypothetical protein